MKLQPDSEDAPLVLDIALFQELRESLGNELEVVVRLYGKFLGSATHCLEELCRQTGTVRAATLHTLKGSAAMVGANRIAYVTTRLHEEALRSMPDEVATAAVGELEVELAAFRRALNAHLASLGHQTPS